MFSKSFGYALRAVTFLALPGNKGKKLSLQGLSQSLAIPHHYLGDILEALVQEGIVQAMSGSKGGFYANARTAETPLLEILILTDGSLDFNHCALHIRHCNSKRPCPLHQEFAACRDQMLQAMSGKTVGKLAERVESGANFLEIEQDASSLIVSFRNQQLA